MLCVFITRSEAKAVNFRHLEALNQRCARIMARNGEVSEVPKEADKAGGASPRDGTVINLLYFDVDTQHQQILRIRNISPAFVNNLRRLF